MMSRPVDAEAFEFMAKWVTFGAELYTRARELGIPHDECMDIETLKMKILLEESTKEQL